VAQKKEEVESKEVGNRGLVLRIRHLWKRRVLTNITKCDKSIREKGGLGGRKIGGRKRSQLPGKKNRVKMPADVSPIAAASRVYTHRKPK